MFSFLARLILFLIAVSVIRSVVNYVRRLWAGATQSRPAFKNPEAHSHARQGSPTELQQDPICGTYVAIDSSLKKIVDGHVYHFCSSECRNRFST